MFINYQQYKKFFDTNTGLKTTILIRFGKFQKVPRSMKPHQLQQYFEITVKGRSKINDFHNSQVFLTNFKWMIMTEHLGVILFFQKSLQ